MECDFHFPGSKKVVISVGFQLLLVYTRTAVKNIVNPTNYRSITHEEHDSGKKGGVCWCVLKDWGGK